jgi:aspartyl-tRNA(Asn)/glutamyl-tRNA(Gln) amidotransferase subunit C
MPVTRAEVEKVAVLAKLKFGEKELDEFTRQFNQILDYINTLNELDTTNVPPTTHVLDLENVFREDVIKPSLPREELLKNAPAQDGEFFKVPKVIK